MAELPLNEVLVRDKATGHTSKVKVDRQLPAPADRPKPPPPTDLHSLSDAHWTAAQRRYQAIEGLRTRDAGVPAILELARNAGVHFTTLYRWFRRFRAGDGRISTLASPGSQGGRGQSRLDPRVQDLIQDVLQESYLNKQKLKISAIRRLIEARCKQEGLAVPAYNTVLARVWQLSSYDRIKARIGAKEAREAATIHRGPFEGAEYPLAIVQIDHTPLDIILVDETARMPIGRPWLTLAIDVYSRMVVGYYLTFDPPGAISVGLCLVHAILPKDAWLAKFGLKAEWPCWGVPTTIHADNGKDFRCESLQRACLEHRINIEWRPLRRANFGGHIERLLGTFLQEMHQLAGTTFSNVAERGNYDSMKTAAFTLREFECWLANFITGNYHQRPHAGLEGQCPLRRYEEGILGTPTQPGRGRPYRVRNERRLLLDFLPGVERSIQEYGVQIDRIIYFSDELRPHVQAVDPEHPFERRRHVFRRDPRDISVIYFLDPNTQDYFIREPHWVSYPKAQQVLGLLEDLLERPRVPRAPCYVLMGATNNGKTALFQRFCDRHAFQDDGRGNGCLPVFYISAPPVADEKRFYDAVLEAMDVRRTSSTVATAQANVIRIFRALGVRVLLIDEIQHLVAAGAIRSRQMMNVLKYMSNDLQISIIGAGVQSAFNALQSDDQMANRFKPVVLPRSYIPHFADLISRDLTVFS